MKRPILIVSIGYIIGIVWGIYLKISIFPICFFIILICQIMKYKKYKRKKVKLLSIIRYKKYIKLIIDRKMIITICVFAMISNLVFTYTENEYKKKYDSLNQKDKLNIIATVVSNKMEKQYKDMYEIKVETIDNSKEYKDIKLLLNIKKKEKQTIKYGDKIYIRGEYIEPEESRNYKGFNYKKYLQTRKIYGSVNLDGDIKILETENVNLISLVINNIKEKIKQNFEKILPENVSNIGIGILLGDTEKIDKDVQEYFRESSIAHVLAVSGLHVIYINIIIEKVLQKLQKSINKKRILTIIILILLMWLTNFSPSVVRAVGMQIIDIISYMIHRKSDSYTSLAITLLILLIYNPYLINNVGLVFSFIGTLGIFFFHNDIAIYINSKKSKIDEKIENKLILEIINRISGTMSLSISVQIVIIPFYIIFFNSMSLTFLIGNILIAFLIGPIMITSIIIATISFVSIKFAEIFSFPLNLLLQLLNQIAIFCSKIPLGKIYIKTPNFAIIVIYYLIIISLKYWYKFHKNKKKTMAYYRNKNILSDKKFKIKRNKEKIIIITCIVLIITVLISINEKTLKIYFIDVGQGDSCFIKTPYNKSILIDGGGNEFNEKFDVGKQILLPYLLNRRITKIDYIIISHFDTDHVEGILTIMKELKVENVIISKQYEKSENYEEFKKVVEEKCIKVKIVKKGDKIKIDDKTIIEILHPDNENIIKENVLNNNSIVCRLIYNKFSILFTGDIEVEAEKQIVDEYSNKLKANILKVAHHGSKSSTMQEFLEKVNPQIALIGVGKSNLYKHPSLEVINRLEEKGIKIFRTDTDGEVEIRVNKNGKISIKKFLI